MGRDLSGNDYPWINPLGGLGDTLMVSGVLKQVIQAEPSRKFNLVVRTKYSHILKGHPAISRIGHPPPGAHFISTDYWSQGDFGRSDQRAYQVLARIFGLKTPAEEQLYVPWEYEEDPVLMKLFPWGERNVLISSSSSSPRKQMGMEKWEFLVEKLARKGLTVGQVGERRDRYIRGSFCLLGLTTPRQVVSLLQYFDAVVTLDNFLMHAAHLCHVPAIVLWGPTDHRVYGYPEQVHLQAAPYEKCTNQCIGPGRGAIYNTECPEGLYHCMNRLDMEAVYQATRQVLDPQHA